MDAAAVDSQRRLVLVRRDDVEHLILIGGPTDVVVERDIRLHGAVRRPAAAGEQAPERAAAAASGRGAGAGPARPAPAAARSEATACALSARLQRAARQGAGSVGTTGNGARAVAWHAGAKLLDAQRPPRRSIPHRPCRNSGRRMSKRHYNDAGKMRPKPAEISLEEEMNRLLGELSVKK